MTDQPHNMALQSTPESILLSQLMNSNLAKNEREWFAAAKIERLTVENERFQLALLMVRTALGLHRDSHDDLVVVAQKIRAENEAMKLEIATLQSENASLWALAKFGDFVIGLRSQGGTLDRKMVIDGMLKTGVVEIDQEGCFGFSSLAKLPEKRE